MPVMPTVVNHVTHQRFQELIPAGPAVGARFLWQNGPSVSVLDESLRTVAGFSVGDDTVLAACGPERLALRRGHTLRITGPDLLEIPGFACSGALFLGDFLIASASSPSGHRLALIELRTGEIVDEIRVFQFTTHSVFHPHPHSLAATAEFISADNVFHVVRIVDGRLNAPEIGPWFERLSGGFNPSGTRLLLAPYGNGTPNISVVAWPGLQEIASATPNDLGTDWIGEFACWIDDDRILLNLPHHGLVMTEATLSNPQPVVWPTRLGHLLDDGDQEARMWPISPGRVAVSLGYFAEGIITAVLDF